MKVEKEIEEIKVLVGLQTESICSHTKLFDINLKILVIMGAWLILLSVIRIIKPLKQVQFQTRFNLEIKVWVQALFQMLEEKQPMII